MPATTHIAFLRAINVGGHTVSMERLRTIVAALSGVTAVETFIASGNVIFQSRAAAAGLESKIEKALQAALGYEVATFLRSPDALADTVVRASRLDAPNVYVGFLREPPLAEACRQVQALGDAQESLQVSGRELFWSSVEGMGRSRISGAALEKALRGRVTFRSVTTVRKLAGKYATPAGKAP